MSAIFIGVGTLKGYWDANANQLYRTDNATTVGAAGSGSTGALTSDDWGSSFDTYAGAAPAVGDYVKVKTAGATELTGETGWGAGDYVVYTSSSIWQKVSATDSAAALVVGAADSDTWRPDILNMSGTVMTFGIDSDNNGTSGYFEWKNNGSTQIAKLDESGDFQIDGDLTVTGNDIHSSTGHAIALSGPNVEVKGNLTVAGSTTTISSTTITVDDKNIELGSVDSPTDSTADGGGITLKGTSDYTIQWLNATDKWTYNQGIQVTSGDILIDSGGELQTTKIAYTDGDDAITIADGGDISLAGNVTVGGNVIKASDGGSTITMDTDDNVAVAGNIQVGGNVIKASDGGSTITMDTSDNVTIAGNVQVGGNIIKASDGGSTITMDTSDNVTIAGDIAAHGGNATIKAANDASAELLLQADNSDDNGDDWKIVCNTNQTLTVANDINGGTFQNYLTLTPHATAGSSLATTAGALQIDGHAIKNSSGENCITFDDDQVVTFPNHFVTTNGPTINGSLTTIQHAGSANLTLKGAAAGANVNLTIIKNNADGGNGDTWRFATIHAEQCLTFTNDHPGSDQPVFTLKSAASAASSEAVVQGMLVLSGNIIKDSSSTPTIVTDGSQNVEISSGSLSIDPTSQAGRLGVGIATPETPLHIRSGSAGSIATTDGALLTLESDGKPKIHFQSPGGYGGSIIFGSPTDNDEGQIDYDHGSDRFLFKTGGSTKMAILGDNVGIGVSDPDSKLEVAGRIHISGEETTPSTPSDGDGGYLYAKSDGKLYWLSSEQSEVDITSGSGGGGGGGAISAVANGANNRVATFNSSDELNGEANFTFDGNALAVEGTVDVSGSTAFGSRTMVDVHQFTGSLALTASGQGGFNGGILASGYGDNFGLHLYASQYAGLGMQSIVDTNGRGSVEVFSTGGAPKHFKYQAGTTFSTGNGETVNLAASGSSKHGTDVNSVHYFSGSVEVNLGGMLVHSSSNAANEYGLECPNVDSYIGTVKAFAHDTYSSIKFKKNVATLPNAMQTVSNLRGVTFDWKESGRTDIGLIAEEVAPVLPQCVSYDRQGEIDGVNYPKIVSVLVQAVKEQNTIISKLQSDIADLKKKV